MSRKSKIITFAVTLAAALVAAGAYAYDRAQEGNIAAGVTIAGIEVGGLSAADAEVKLRRQLSRPLHRPLRVVYRDRSWSLPARALKARADLHGAVERAVRASRAGGLPTRLGRYLGGGELEREIAAPVHYSRRAIGRLVDRVTRDIGRAPRDAAVEPGAATLTVVRSRPGLDLRDARLTRELREAAGGTGPRTVRARVRRTAPEVPTAALAARYPSYLTLDRGGFTLRLWKNLKPARTYTVAVGQEGLETPEGVYEIEVKEANPTWFVPDSDWAGELAGEVIPPGPANPIKARWMAIYEGAGIHGTEDVASLGSAASHGCVRMSIPDVEELYDEVRVGTPIFIG